MFLKVIDEFTYDHSEDLGDAFEYLLSVLAPKEMQASSVPKAYHRFHRRNVDPKKTETGA